MKGVDCGALLDPGTWSFGHALNPIILLVPIKWSSLMKFNLLKINFESPRKFFNFSGLSEFTRKYLNIYLAVQTL